MSTNRTIGEEELIPFHQEVYQSADKLTRFFLIGYFIVGLGISYFNETWLLGTIMGASLLAIYFGSAQLLKNTELFRFVTSLLFWLFPLQFILQMHGEQTTAFFYFVSLTVLLFNEDKFLLLPVII